MTKHYTWHLNLIFTGLIGLSACSNAKTFVPTNTDTFIFYEHDYYQQASKLLQADYLIVPDMSFSMRASKDSLEYALDEFAKDLAAKNIDYRIGFVRGTTQSRDFYPGAIPSDFMGPILHPESGTSARSQIASALAQLAEPNAPNWVFIMEAAKKTLQNKGSSFLRGPAQLVLVFISDSDERDHPQVPYNNTHYINAFKAMKSNPDYISARAFVTGIGSCPLFGSTDYGYKAGTRLSAVANAVDSLNNGTFCLRYGDDMADSLKNVARDVSKKTKRFKLQAQPVPGTVSVLVNGGLIPQNHGTYSWIYDSSNNEIVFNTAIPESASLQINYDMMMKLSREPRINSIVVTLNGAIVPKSDSNGWQYNPATKELYLSGSYAPSHTDKIVVSYEVQ
jgi:hypothetical protein